MIKNLIINNFIIKLEDDFERVLAKKGYQIKKIKEDGACLFRAVADQVYGDEEMHSTIRCHCMDYIVRALGALNFAFMKK